MLVRSLGWEGLPEEEMATHASILAWEIPWTEEPGGLVHGVARAGHDLASKPPLSFRKEAAKVIRGCGWGPGPSVPP